MGMILSVAHNKAVDNTILIDRSICAFVVEKA